MAYGASMATMKPLLLFVTLLYFQGANSCEFLYGTWQSSVDESYSFSIKNPDIKIKQLDFIEQAFGHLKVTYSENEIQIHQTDETQVLIEGKSYPFSFDGHRSKISYLTCSEGYIEVEYEYFGYKDTFQFTVVNDDLYWVKLESEIGREYFRRIK